MYTISTFFKILLITILLSSCSKNNDCLEGNGNIVTQSLNLDTFSKISNTGSIEVTISQGDTQSISLTGDSNIIEKLITEVTNEELQIELASGCYTDFNLDMDIVVTDFTKLSSTGSGNIIVNPFTNQETLSIKTTGSSSIKINSFVDTHTLDAEITGSGSIILKGDNFFSLENTEVSVSGSGRFLGFDVPSQNYNVNVSGSGKCEVYATNTLNIDVSGSGKVYYIGNPIITQSISGSGDVVNKN